MKQTIYRFVSLAIMLVMAASLTVSCGPTEPDPDQTPATVAVTGVSLDKTSLDLIEGGTETLTATVSPDNATNKKVSWKSSDTAVATVDDNGKVTAVKAGSATITVTADGGKTATCSVKVTEQAKIVITGNTAKVPVQGGTAEFKIQYNTSYTVEIEQSAQSWLHFVETKAMQSGTLVFKVDANDGEARTGKATVKDNAGKVGAITLTFEQDAYIAVASVQIAPEAAELEIGETLTLTATVLPENATDKTVIWSTDNASVATVSENGTVTTVAQGTATIIAAAGEAKASCAITVTPPIQEVERAALIAFYEATGGDKWIHNQNWCSDKPLSEWYGIVLNGYGRVSSIYLYENNLDGQLPSEFFSLSDLEVLELSYNNLHGEIPDPFYDLKKLRFVNMDSNRISGELSERLWSLPDLEQLLLTNNNISGQLTPAIKNAKKLTWLGLGSNQLTGTIPKEIAELTDLHYLSLENHEIALGHFSETSNEISGPIPDNLDKLQNLEYFLVENNNLEGNIPICFAKMPKLIDLELYGNRLSGVVPEELTSCSNWDIWAPDKYIIPQQEGYTLTYDYYESTDYSKDGQVTKLQTHEKGNGINIIITGDCFTDRDIAAGLFDAVARQTMEDFFSIEPFTSFRNLFDVYAVTAVSKTNYSNYETALGVVFGEGSSVSCDEEIVKQYSLKAVNNLDETLTIVMVNKNSNSGTAFMPPYPAFDTDYGSGFSYACFGLQDDEVARRLLLNHEANGHGFTKLQDEYFYKGGTPYPEEQKQYIIDNFFSKGFYSNIDFESDPTKVKWARFLSDERYKYDGLGVFEGGMTFEKGVWRPTFNSIMRNDTPTGEGSRFNAPSRLAAYYRIHKLAYGSAWEFDYEEFVKYDAINRMTSADASSASSLDNIAGDMGLSFSK